MSGPLLATKLRVPPQTRHLVRRARLIDALERGVCEDDSKLILVSAPAGYGKTTLLAQWARASRARVAWFSIGEEDNDPERFFRSLLAAWAAVQPGINESPLALLLNSREPDLEAILSSFINVASEFPGHAVFVLDDAHLIEDPSIHEAMTFLLDHFPPAFHFLLVGRSDPPLPLARYRARHELSEIRTEELQFLLDETAALLNLQMNLDLAADEIASLHAQLEGWIAGLQLVSLTLRRREAVPPVVSGRHRFIADYLGEDVLAQLPEEIRRFLLQTSLLDRLCGSLCDAVTASASRQETLEFLDRENLFLVSLDDNREWFRYHRLFANVLRQELQRRYGEEIPDLHRRAARWYLDRNLPEEASRHAVAGSDPALVARIAARHVSVKLFGGEVRVVQHWMASLPEAWFASQPELGLAQAAMFLFLGQFEDCARGLEEVARLARAGGEETRGSLAKVTAMRCYIACFHRDLERAEVLAKQALQELPEDDLICGPVSLCRLAIPTACMGAGMKRKRATSSRWPIPTLQFFASSPCTSTAPLPISSCARAGCGRLRRTERERWQSSRIKTRGAAIHFP